MWGLGGSSMEYVENVSVRANVSLPCHTSESRQHRHHHYRQHHHRHQRTPSLKDANVHNPLWMPDMHCICCIAYHQIFAPLISEVNRLVQRKILTELRYRMQFWSSSLSIIFRWSLSNLDHHHMCVIPMIICNDHFQDASSSSSLPLRCKMCLCNPDSRVLALNCIGHHSFALT